MVIEKKEAIIILAAKKRGPQDTLAEYQSYLKRTKTYKLPGSKMQKSEPKTVKVSEINSQRWVDALHLASEVPGFYTRYLATVKADIGVAVTFSVTKSLYSQYKGVFDNVIASMRVFRQENKNLANLNLKGKKSENFDDTTFVPEEGLHDISAKKKRKKGSGSDDTTSMAIIGLALVGGFLLLKKLKKGKGSKGKKS